MVTSRTYQEGDRNFLELRDGDEMGVGEFSEESGPTWTLLDDGVPFAIFGFQYSSDCVYDLWGVGTEKARGHGLFVVKTISKIVEDAFRILEIHRVQATCRTDRPEYRKFLELLGFKWEGTLRQLAPDRSDLHIFSRVKD